MRFNVLSILGASMLATAGLSADSVNLAGAFDLNGELAKCNQGDDACVTRAQAMDYCWSNVSTVQSELDNCLADAQRAYDMTMQGVPASVAAANASGDKAVVTDADNAKIEEMDGKGMKDAH